MDYYTRMMDGASRNFLVAAMWRKLDGFTAQHMAREHARIGAEFLAKAAKTIKGE